jgi:hypothetical protein
MQDRAEIGGTGYLPTTPTPSSEPQEDPLKPVIRAMFDALSADYGDRFLSQFRGPGASKPNAWKYRMLALLKGISPAAVVEGFEQCCAEHPEFPPTARSIADAAKRRAAEIANLERQQAEANRRAMLAAPAELACEAGQARILQMRREAFARAAEGGEEGRAQRLKAALAEHEAILRASGVLRRTDAAAMKLCAVAGCDRPGTVAHSTRPELWLCSEHGRRR